MSKRCGPCFLPFLAGRWHEGGVLHRRSGPRNLGRVGRAGYYPRSGLSSHDWVMLCALSPFNKGPRYGMRSHSNGFSGGWTWLARFLTRRLSWETRLTALLAALVAYLWDACLTERLDDLWTYSGYGCSDSQSLFDANHGFPSIGVLCTVSRPGQEGRDFLRTRWR